MLEIEVTLSDYSPDVIIENTESNQKWLIELAVTSFIGTEKLEKIKRDNLNCLEIDLKKVDRKINSSELKELIINNLEHRTILNKEKTEIEKEKSDENYWVYLIGILIAFLGFRRLFKRKKL